jgi:cobalt-zinc-cadmium efflux system outer membrane protein
VRARPARGIHSMTSARLRQWRAGYLTVTDSEEVHVNSFRRPVLPIVVAGAVVVLGLVVTTAGAQAPAPHPAVKFLRLEELERIALANNPTVAQAEAIVRSVLGRKRQAFFYPNPIVGVQIDEIKARQPSRSQYFLWAQQTIVTGDKRKHLQAAVAQEQIHAETEKTMQRQAVLNAVKLLFYETLGAWRTVEVRRDLAGIAREAVETSEQLYNIGQADRPDVLEVQVEAERAEVEVARAENELERVWQELAAVVGQPSLPLTPLAGDLEAELPTVDEATVRSQILKESPELRIARTRIAHGEAVLARARADRIPNFFVRGGAGYDLDRADNGKGNVGPEFFFEVGIPLPIFDTNAGNIAQAEAQLQLARNEARRVELTLFDRLGGVQRNYRDAQQTVERYQQRILGQAQQGYELYRQRFQQMAAAYPQVLIAQRTLAQVRVEYVRALVELWQAALLLQGQLVRGALEAPAAIPGEPPITIEAVPFTVTP